MGLLTDLLGDGNATSSAGVYADIGAASASNAGHLYFATDVDGGTLYRSNGTAWVQVASSVAAERLLVAKVTNEVTNNSDVLQDDDELSVTVDANKVYAVELSVEYSAAAAADIKFGFAAPAGATFNWRIIGLAPAATSALADMKSFTENVSQSINVGAVSVGTKSYAIITGTLRTGANPGNLTLQWAQNTADPSNCTVYKDSWLRAEVVG